MKMPKQIYYWAYKAGLHQFQSSTRHKYHTWKGHGRYWRVNMRGEFQASEGYHSFDRWANSTLQTWQMPKCEQEFVELVRKYHAA